MFCVASKLDMLATTGPSRDNKLTGSEGSCQTPALGNQSTEAACIWLVKLRGKRPRLESKYQRARMARQLRAGLQQQRPLV